MRIVLADDQRLFREGLRTLLTLEQDIEVVGEAASGEEALAVCQRTRPDLVLMDLRMPGSDGVHGTALLREAMPEVKVVILTTFDDEEAVMEALHLGAVGYLLKDLPGEEIAAALRTVMGGGAILPPEITAKVLSELARRRPSAVAGPVTPRGADSELIEALTEREEEVLRLVAAGHSNKEIADELYITEGTVKNHVSNLIQKAGVRDRTQLALLAVRGGFDAFGG